MLYLFCFSPNRFEDDPAPHAAGRRAKSPLHPIPAPAHNVSVLVGLSGPIANSQAAETPQIASSTATSGTTTTASRGVTVAATAIACAGLNPDESGGIEDLVGSDDVSYATSVASMTSPAGSARVATGPSSTLRLPAAIDDSGIVDEAGDVSYAPSVEMSVVEKTGLPRRPGPTAAAAPPSSFGAVGSQADEEAIEDVVDGPDDHYGENSGRMDASWASVVSGDGAVEKTGP
jgi:hypothetical protein